MWNKKLDENYYSTIYNKIIYILLCCAALKK